MNPPSPGAWLEITGQALREPDIATAVHTLLTSWARSSTEGFAFLLPDGNAARLFVHAAAAPTRNELRIAAAGVEPPLHIEEINLSPALPPAPALTGRSIAFGDGPPALWFADASEGPIPLLETLRLVLEVHDRLRKTSEEDGLTGLANRRAFDRLLRREADLTARYGGAFTILVLDLDGFKQVNDRLGHAAGDALLRSVGIAMRASLRASDTAARLGGDEFAILLPRSNTDAADRVVRRLGEAVAALAPASPLTFCCGILETMSGGPSAPTPESLMARSDELLYAAKQHRPGGRAVGVYRPA